MKKYDVVALGELLIDFTENGMSAQGNPVLEANPGGAPCNVLSMLTKLGHNTAFIGKVGNDMFGRQLETGLTEAGIGTEGLLKDDEVHTTLAFVQTMSDGDRDFSFYRDPGADMMLSVDDVNAQLGLIENCKIFHFGSLSMTHDGCREATKAAVAAAKSAGAWISFDPNLREPLWESEAVAKEQIGWGLSVSDIVKISDNEIAWFTESADEIALESEAVKCVADYDADILDNKAVGNKDVITYEKMARKLLKQFPNIKLLTVSLGKEGSLAFVGDGAAYSEAYLRPDTIETTGAGDAFCGCVLHYVLEQGLYEYSKAELEKMISFANVAAALVTTRKGALKVMPDINEILGAYLAGKIQGKDAGKKKRPMHVCQHTGQEPCLFHTPEHYEMVEQL